MAENDWGDLPANEWGDKPEASVPASEKPVHGIGEALARGVAQGATLGFADEIGGMARAGVKVPAEVRTPGPKALAKMYPGVPYPEAAAKWFDANRPDVQAATGAESARQQQSAAYESERDKIREADRAAREAHPVIFGAGEVGGTLVSAPLMPIAGAARGAPLMARVAEGAKAAAPLGAAFGLGASESPDVSGQVKDVAIGAATAGALGGAVPAVQEATSRVARPVADWLHGQAMRYGRKALTGNAGAISVKKPLSDEAVQAALNAGAIKPLSGVQGIADRLGTSVDVVEQKLGDVLSQLEAAGVQGPNPAVVENILKTQGLDAFRNSGLEKIRRIYAEAANSLSEIGQVQRGNLGLTQAERIKRAHQREANYTKAQRDTNAMGAQKEVASILRQANEDAVAAQASKAPDLAAQFVPLKQELGPLLEAQGAADVAAARAARNRGISLTDTIAGAAGMSHAGIPGAAVMALANKLGRTRGPSTLSWLANKGAGTAEAMASGASTPSATPLTPTVLDWARGRIGADPLPVGIHAAAAGDDMPAGSAPAPTPVQGEQHQGNEQPPSHDPDLGTSGAVPQVGQAAPKGSTSQAEHVHVGDRIATLLANDPQALGAYAAPLAIRLRTGGPRAVAAYDFVESSRNPKYREMKARTLGDERLT